MRNQNVIETSDESKKKKERGNKNQRLSIAFHVSFPCVYEVLSLLAKKGRAKLSMLFA
jgi:hypothetical protein